MRLNEVALREIPGYDGLYSASDDGRIWSHHFNRWLATYSTHGYLRVDLTVNYAKTKARVHRLVALVWVPNPANLPEVNHCDGNKLNNVPSNLEWCDRDANMQHRYRSGVFANPHGART